MFFHLPIASLSGPHLSPAHPYVEGNKRKGGRCLSRSSAVLEQLPWSHWSPKTKLPPEKRSKTLPMPLALALVDPEWLPEAPRGCCGEGNGHSSGQVLAPVWQWQPLFRNTPLQVRTWHSSKTIGCHLLLTCLPCWRFQGLDSLLMLLRRELLESIESLCLGTGMMQGRGQLSTQRRASCRGCSISEHLYLKC